MISKNKILDCITFFDNNFMFDLRYNILKDFVDYFIICESKYNHKGIEKKKNFIWKKKVIEAIRYLNKNNYYVFIVSNQSGVGRGYYSTKDVDKLHLWMKNELKKNGAYIDEIFYAPFFKKSKLNFTKKDEILRKPNTGMIDKANKSWNIEMKNSYVIGDSTVDKNLARNAKLKYVNVNKKSNLLNIVKKICK